MKDNTCIKETAISIVKALRENKYEAFFVGGSVRDMYLGKIPKDYDILTTAKPSVIKKLFKKTIPVGEKFGIMVVHIKSVNYEVATARKDGNYFDARHPEKVTFCGIEEDIKRRDFTMNALLYDPVKKKYIDYVGGKEDIRKKIIKTVGDPDRRFSEDALRMLRAVRFSCQLNFSIEDDTLQSVKRKAGMIQKISPERIRDEIIKMAESGKFLRGLKLLAQTGLLKIILPEVEKLKNVNQPKKFHPEGDVYKHTLLTVGNLKNKTGLLTNLAALFHDIAKPATFKLKKRITFYGHDKLGEKITEGILRRLKFPNEVIKKVSEIVGNHMYFISVRKMRPAKLKRLIMRETFGAELDLHRADCLASHKDISNYTFLLKKQKEFKKEKKTADNIRLLNGYDLISLGLKPGPLFKKILTEVENAFLESRIKDKKQALAFVKEKFL